MKSRTMITLALAVLLVAAMTPVMAQQGEAAGGDRVGGVVGIKD